MNSIFLQAADERNYHIFYQMCAARDLPELSTLCLKEPDEVHLRLTTCLIDWYFYSRF